MALANNVFSHHIARYQQDQQTLETFAREFPELANGSDEAKQFVAFQVNRIRQNNQAYGITQPNIDVLRAAGSRVRAVLGEPVQPQPPPPALQVASRDDLVERKESMIAQPNGVDRRALPSPSSVR